MSNKFQSVAQTFFVRKKSKPQLNPQQNDSQKKQYRILNAIFQSNLTKFSKKHKQCFNGGIQIPINKIAISVEQLQSNKNIKDNFDKYSQRLIKSMLQKNNNILKNIQCFDQQKNKQTIIFQADNIQDDDNNQKNKLICYQSQRSIQKRQSRYEYKSTKQQNMRPMSAILQRQSINNKNIQKKSIRPLSSFSLLHKQHRRKNTYTIKNIDVDNIYILDKQRKKTPLARMSLAAGCSQFQRFQQEQVYIRRKIQNNHNSPIKQGRSLRSSQFSNKKAQRNPLFKKYQNLYTKNQYSKNQYQNLMQKQKLQNKIMMINTVLAFNLTQTHHAYKPKSKCW